MKEPVLVGERRSFPVLREEPSRFLLAMDGAPEPVNHVDAGSLYCLSIKPALHHVGLICATLLKNLDAGIRCIVITPLAPENFLERCAEGLRERLLAAIDAERIVLFTMIGDYRKNIALLGPEKLLGEITRAGMSENCLLLVDQAEQLFSLHYKDEALDQLETYQNWLGRNKSAALLLFSRLADDPAVASGYHAVSGKTSGNASLTRHHEQSQLWIEFWNSSAGSVSELSVMLSDSRPNNKLMNVSGLSGEQPRLEAAVTGLLAEQIAKAHDAGDVYVLGDIVMPANISGFKQWKPVTSLVEMIHIAQKACAATLIIAAGKETDCVHLAQAVQTIRYNAGAMLRIVILDSGRSMRYQHEMLLLRVGANVVVREEMSAARLRLLLESLQSQLYLRPDNIAYDDAYASVVPPRLKGFLSPVEFCSAVRAALVQAKPLDLPCALIALDHSPADDVPSSIARFSLSREGDLLTACTSRCYVFLYGCVVADLWALLPRLLGLHDIQTIGSPLFLNKEKEIVAMVQQIEGFCQSGQSQSETGISISFKSPLNLNAVTGPGNDSSDAPTLVNGAQ